MADKVHNKSTDSGSSRGLKLEDVCVEESEHDGVTRSTWVPALVVTVEELVVTKQVWP